MGLFSKIKEMIRRNKTPKLNAGNEYQQNQYQDPKSINYLEQPYTITLSNDGQELMVTLIKFENNVSHSNGQITNLMIAKAVHYQEGGTIYFNQEESIAFEVPAGAQIDDVILQKIGQYYMYERNMPDNNKDCMYIGKLSPDPYDLGTNNKSEAVKRYIDEIVAPQIAREKQEQIERQMQSYRERQERENIRQTEFVNRMQEEYKIYEQKQNNIKRERMQNPYLKQNGQNYMSKDGKKYYDYDGVNISNGEILRLRRMNKVGKDEYGTYLYTGYIDTTSNEHDAEMLSGDSNPIGVPICFATDKKIEDIIYSNNTEDLTTLLSILSQNNVKNTETLNYIGKINRNNMIDLDVRNVTNTLQNAIGKLQQEFYQEKMQQQEKEI